MLCPETGHPNSAALRRKGGIVTKNSGKIPRKKVVGNYAKPPLHRDTTPEFLTFPLTDYRTRSVNGTEVRNLPEEDVFRLREFDEENQK